MGKTNKADKLDATGFAVLLRNGTLPEVWIPPGDLRDQRELPRMRIFRVRLCPQVKNPIHATLARHNVSHTTDLFSVGARSQLAPRLAEWPVYSREVVQQELGVLDSLDKQIESAGQRLEAVLAMARHLAEAVRWVLKRPEVYREPLRKAKRPVLSSMTR